MKKLKPEIRSQDHEACMDSDLANKASRAAGHEEVDISKPLHRGPPSRIPTTPQGNGAIEGTRLKPLSKHY